jgi:hypothetical protein
MSTQYHNILNTIPEHIVSNYPLFTDFIKAYYEYLEQTGNPSDIINNLSKYASIDGTLDSFLEYFKLQYMNNIPKDIMCDERLLLKHIKELYNSKGSEASYRLLFRALYNKEISFYTPGDSVLRPSDSKWKQDYSICVKIQKTVPYESILTCLNKKVKITGTDGLPVYALVTNIRQLKDLSDSFDDGYHYLEFFVINNLTTIDRIKSIS